LEDDTKQFKHVKTFTEKPNEELAQTFLDSGDFLWNAGIFVWNFKTFVKESESAMPETYEFFKMIEADLNTKNEAKSIDNVYSRLNSISIDYALLEKSKDVCVIPADFEWSDLGTWSSLYELMEKDYLGNGVNGNLIRIYDASNNLIVSQKDKLTIIEGIENSIIVDTEDTLMILSKSKEQEVKNFTTDLKRDKLEKFL
jgi:mannose-1-phosphate guanylyltransferase